MSEITKVVGLEILDSRGNWTVEARVELEGKFLGQSSVPAGASVGIYEKKTVPAKTSASAINSLLSRRLVGANFDSQKEIDEFLIGFDADPERSSLGANTILSISVAFAKAEALKQGWPLYQYFTHVFSRMLDDGSEAVIKPTALSMPVPLFNVINGGLHAESSLDFQEFHLIPRPQATFEGTLESGVSQFHSLGMLLESNGFGNSLGDEGGFAPQNISISRALNFIEEAGQKIGLTTGKDFFLGLDTAASTFSFGDMYDLKREGIKKTKEELFDYYLELLRQFPIVYLEDPFGQDDYSGFAALKKRVKDKVDIVGDDLITTNLERLKKALKTQAVSATVIKPNQIGTLHEAMTVAALAVKNGLSLVVSHRSAETEDTYIADLAVGLKAKYLKAGAPARGERVAKYNRLLEIEKELSS